MHAGQLTTLQGQKAALEEQICELERRKVEEGNITLLEALPYLPHFLSDIRTEATRLGAAISQLEESIELKKEDVMQAWQETEKTNHLEVREKLAMRLEQERLEQMEADERSVIAYARSLRRSA